MRQISHMEVEMDYMRGYNNRNKRRRSSRNRVQRPKNDFINSGYYKSKSKYVGNTRTDSKQRVAILAGVLCAVFLMLVFGLIVMLNRKNSTKPSQNGTKVVSDSATKVMAETAPKQTMEPDGVAAEVAAVATLAPNVVPTLTPTPRPKAIALTFDDGPRVDSDKTTKVLNLLKKYNAHATFFVVGQYVSAGAEVLKQEVAQGCEIGNHSWDHSNLAELPMKKVNRQYNKTAALVKKLVGYDIKLLRPPYGAISDKMRKSLKHPMVLWNVDTLDWKSKNPKKILKMVKKHVKDGDIILMHDIHPTTAKSLETVLPWLVKNGYDILTVSELAKRKGAVMNNGKAYGGFQ